jgi:topoisomerase-4 subunit B
VVDAVSKMNTGGKYDSKAFKKSVGLNGVGTKAVNALSDYFRVRSFRDGKMKAAEFSRGIIKNFDEKDTSDRNGTEISFIPDGDIFLHFKFRKEYIERMLRNYAYLNPGLKILFNGETYFLKTDLKICWKKSWKTISFIRLFT